MAPRHPTLDFVERLLTTGRTAEAWRRAHRALESAFRRGLDSARGGNLLTEVVSLALHYGHEEPAERAVAILEEAATRYTGADAEKAREIAAALRVQILLAVKDSESASEVAKGVRWEAISDLAWTANLRLALSSSLGDYEAAMRLLEAGLPEGAPPYELANRLRILAQMELERGDLERSLRYAFAALKRFRDVSGLRARLREIELRYVVGRLFFETGYYDRAEDEFLNVLELENDYGDTRYAVACTGELAWIWAREGRFAEATRFIKRTPLRTPKTPRDVYVIVRLLATRAAIALEAAQEREALAVLKRAEKVLAAFPHPRLQAYLWITRGYVEARAARDPRRALRAEAHLERASKILRRIGRPDPYAEELLLLGRGHIHLRRRDTREALACCREVLARSEKRRFIDIRERALLLKSYLLVEAGVPSGELLYEEMLRELGLVHNTALLFRVLANLYIYTWELEGHLELTDHHLQQLVSLREILDADVFHRLYTRYVTARVARRAITRLFGIDPTDLLATD